MIFKIIRMFFSKELKINLIFKLIFCTFMMGNIPIVYSIEKANEFVIHFDFNKEQIPYVGVEIDNKSYVFLIDLGADNGISIRKDLLKKLNGIKFTGKKVKFTDISGSKYTVREYIIPKVNIGGYDYKNIKGYESVNWGVHIESKDHGNELYGIDKFDGVIGRGLLNNYDLIINYNAKQLVVILNQESNYAKIFNNTKNVPFVLDKDGIKINLFVNNKKSIFILDTGSSMSIISNKYAKLNGGAIIPCNKVFDFDMDCEVLQASSLTADKKKLAPMNFMIYDFQGLSTDGILGYDFFISNKIMLLFNKKVIKFSSSR